MSFQFGDTGAELLKLVEAAGEGASDLQAIDIVALDVGDIISITDWFVIASGTNVRQVRRIAEQVEESVK